MAFILTPRQLTERAEFYHQLGQLTSAGIPLTTGLEHLKRSPPSKAYIQPTSALLERLSQGSTFTESLISVSNWLPEFDIALIRAGEQSGRLDSVFRLLGDYYADRAKLARQVIGDLAYPAFLLHFAVFVLPFAQWFQSGNTLRYLGQTFGVLIPLYAVVLGLIYAAQSRHGEVWRGAIESICGSVPVLGTARRDLALARLASALEALLSAGVTIIQAWELAAAASGSPALRRTVLAWRPLVEAGQTPAEVVNISREFPPLFANQYATGEVSGKLDETLRGLNRYFQEEGSRKLHHIARWVPRFIYFGIMLMIAYRVVSWWANYFKEVGAAAGF